MNITIDHHRRGAKILQESAMLHQSPGQKVFPRPEHPGHRSERSVSAGTAKLHPEQEDS